MVLGNAGKKLGTMIELAEDLYEKVTEVKQQLEATRDTVEDTSARVAAVERELAAQRAVLDAVAEEHDLEPDRIRSEVAADADGETPPTPGAGSTPDGED